MIRARERRRPEAACRASPVLIERTAQVGGVNTVTIANKSNGALDVTVNARPWTQSASGVVSPEAHGHARRRGDQREGVHARGRARPRTSRSRRTSAPAAGYLYGALEVVGLPSDVGKRKGVVTGYRMLGSLRYNAATPVYSLKLGAAKIAGTGSKKTLTLAVRNAGNTIAPVTGDGDASRARPGPRTASVKATRILPGKNIALGLASGNSLARRQLHGHRHAHAGQAEDDDHEEDHGAPLSELEALLEAAPLDGRRIRDVVREAVAGGEPAEIVARTGVTLREVERILAAAGRCRSGRRCGRRDALERMRALLARVPEPLADLDHVPATAETVLERVRYLHERYELERCRVLLLGDHDATSLAFAVLGVAPRELAVVDVDQRQLQLPGGRGRRHVVRRPARRPAGAAARALRRRPHRPAVLARGRRAVRGARRSRR